MNTFQIITIPFCLALAILTLIRRQLSPGQRQGLFWAVVWLGGALVIAIPQIASWLASLMGIGRGVDLILYVAALAGLLMVRHFYFKQRRLECLVTELLREQALRAPLRGPAGIGYVDSPRAALSSVPSSEKVDGSLPSEKPPLS